MKVFSQAMGYGLLVITLCGLLLFWPASTFDYWQAWVFLAIYAVIAIACVVYWGVTNPAVLQRRLRGGPTAETRPAQKLASAALVAAFAGSLPISALDHRFGWSSPPTSVSVFGEVLAALGLGLGVLTVMQNAYAGATITVEEEQPLISTGLYGLVRHPMYFSLLVTMIGIPLALGSYWGLAGALVCVPILVLRIADEERLLIRQLTGYGDYTRRVRYRLLPYVW